MVDKNNNIENFVPILANENKIQYNANGKIINKILKKNVNNKNKNSQIKNENKIFNFDDSEDVNLSISPNNSNSHNRQHISINHSQCTAPFEENLPTIDDEKVIKSVKGKIVETRGSAKDNSYLKPNLNPNLPPSGNLKKIKNLELKNEINSENLNTAGNNDINYKTSTLENFNNNFMRVGTDIIHHKDESFENQEEEEKAELHTDDLNFLNSDIDGSFELGNYNQLIKKSH